MNYMKEALNRIERIAQKYEKHGMPEKAVVYRSYQNKIAKADTKVLMSLYYASKQNFDKILKTL